MKNRKKYNFEQTRDDEKERTALRAETYKVITAEKTSSDYQAYTAKTGPKEGQKAAAPPKSPSYRLCLALICGVVCITVIVLAIFLGINAGSSTSPTPAPPMVSTTLTPGPIATEGPEVESALNATDPVVVITLRCNHAFGNGTCVAVFNYDNPTGSALVVEAGANNLVEPGAEDVGQTQLFAAGSFFGGASFVWDCAAHLHARWTLRAEGGAASVATAPHTHLACPPLPM